MVSISRNRKQQGSTQTSGALGIGLRRWVIKAVFALGVISQIILIQIGLNAKSKKDIVAGSASGFTKTSAEGLLPLVDQRRKNTVTANSVTVLPWKKSSILPDWFKDFVIWQQKQRKSLKEENWDDFQYLVLRCLNRDAQCGGTADRLASLPAKAKLAAKYRRILLVIWERPCKLEEFLVPPPGGLDWTAPDWLRDKLLPLMNKTGMQVFSDQRDWVIAKAFQEVNTTMLDVMTPMGEDCGESWYNAHLQHGEPNFAQVYHEMWSTLFQPTAPVQARINAELKALQLQPGEYDSFHIRAQYSYLSLEEVLLSNYVLLNATNCALFGHKSNRTLYVASDTAFAIEKAVKHAAQYHRHAVARKAGEKAHLDRGTNFLSPEVDPTLKTDAFYDTFVDLYMLAMSRCSTFGRGGYGRWANWIGSYSKCSLRYFHNRKYVFPADRCTPPHHMG